MIFFTVFLLDVIVPKPFSYIFLCRVIICVKMANTVGDEIDIGVGESKLDFFDGLNITYEDISQESLGSSFKTLDELEITIEELSVSDDGQNNNKNLNISDDSVESTDAELEDNKLKSVVVKCKKHVFGSDDKFGRLNNNIINVIIKNGTIDDIIQKVKQEVKSLDCVVMLSVGNSIPTSLFGEMIHIDNFMKSLNKFNEEVKSAGGKLVVTSLIPNPSETDPRYAKSNALTLQIKLSNLYVELGNRIYKFNEENGNFTPHLKAYLEVKNIKNRSGDIDEKKTYITDGNTPRTQKKMLRQCFCQNRVTIREDIKAKLRDLCEKKIDEISAI